MFVPEDEGHIHRILGSSEVPHRVSAEYELRKGLWHAGGESGPLGLMACIEIIRFCGENPKHAVNRPAQISWDKISPGTEVVADVDGRKIKGEYDHRVTAGTLAINLATVTNGFTSEVPEKDVTLLQYVDPSEVIVEGPEPDIDSTPGTVDVPEQEEVLQYGDPINRDSVDWEKMTAGDLVEVSTSEGMKQAKFIEAAGDTLMIEINEDHIPIEEEYVQPFEPVKA